MVCTFFGHRDCYELEGSVLQAAVEKLIAEGVDTFYVGHQGDFDRMVFACLRRLRDRYPHISFSVVLAYLPSGVSGDDPYEGYSLYPEGLELVPPRFAIEKRNEWMLCRADVCLCYVKRARGGAYKFMKRAEKKGRCVINLGSKDTL